MTLNLFACNTTWDISTWAIPYLYPTGGRVVYTPLGSVYPVPI